MARSVVEVVGGTLKAVGAIFHSIGKRCHDCAGLRGTVRLHMPQLAIDLRQQRKRTDSAALASQQDLCELARLLVAQLLDLPQPSTHPLR